jgi:undecaprenyl-diphosphatase
VLFSLQQIDTSIFQYLNGLHSPFFDVVMWWASNEFIWIPLYAGLLYLLIRQNPGRAGRLLFMVILLIVLSDQSANLAKSVFERLRPSHEPSLNGLVHLLRNYSGGDYGFYSGHASSSFAVAVFVILLAGQRNKWLIPLMLCYAVLVSYSRIYLGVHYPGDILVGAIIGSIYGYALSRLYFMSIRHSARKPQV